jgi:amidophosphoribosyltransferase
MVLSLLIVKEACGIFGIYAPGEDISRLIYFGLYALQHRGQESAGISVSSGRDIILYKDMGLVNQVFDEKILGILKGEIGIGHVRYSTTGSSVPRNAQPLLVEGKKHKIALAHNGNLINSEELRKKLLQNEVNLVSTTDSEIIAYYIANSSQDKIEDAILESLPKFKGAYSILILTCKELIAIRDPYGIRPLSIGKLNSFYVFASETCALNTVGADYLREVQPGEVVIVDENGLRSIIALPSKRKAICIFEFIYFARPDSYIYGKNLHLCRRRMGQILAEEKRTTGDIVIPLPDSGIPAAIGYAEKSKIPFGEGIIKNRYILRTFIQPDQRMRELDVKMKLNPLKENLKNKRVILVDDSIVRGTTSKKLVKLLKESGAKEVHVRVSSPPIKYPCYYGIDMATHQELIASSHTVEEIKEILEADSLYYLTIEGLISAVELPKEYFCLACFNDDYPIKIPKQLEFSKFAFEKTSTPTIMKR